MQAKMPSFFSFERDEIKEDIHTAVENRLKFLFALVPWLVLNSCVTQAS